MSKPKLMSGRIGNFGKILMSGLNKFRAYDNENHSSNAKDGYSASEMVIGSSNQEALNRSEFYKGLAIEMMNKRKYI